MSAEHWIYHLTSRPVSRAVAELCEKALERGMVVDIISPSADRLTALDEALWMEPKDAFLPHVRWQEDLLEGEPLRLGTVPCPNPPASLAILLDGARLTEPRPYARVMWVFEDADTVARDAARDAFKQAKTAGTVARYFTEAGSGGWTETARTGPKSE
jgi:DNA polymerase-3 subunit chi